ncbi:hypothetical protein QF037_009749 [Streptomyces canus]|nr:hypothetical protein [Streptomyces canus]MDQ0605404.1 hypothetical protein [Streptomyces canus]
MRTWPTSFTTGPASLHAVRQTAEKCPRPVSGVSRSTINRLLPTD